MNNTHLGIGIFLCVILLWYYYTQTSSILKLSELNSYKYNGQDIICPPQYNFGEQIRFNPEVRNLWGSKDICWMGKDRNDCFNGTCDPTQYKINGQNYSNLTTGDPRGLGIVTDIYKGKYIPSKFTTYKNPIYVVSGVPSKYYNLL
jgi:hypothetical protein